MKIEVRKPTAEESERASRWPIWSKEASTFDWQYDDRETCLILAGRVTVTGAGLSVDFGAGDWVVFPQGLSCTWKIHEDVRKHYCFG